MQTPAHEAFARDIMETFASNTGLSPPADKPRRYLWTDAFAVCNFLGLYRRTREEKYLGLALDLVAQVHETLGKHREDDPRSGWISGLEETQGHAHPTIGGLRIGKTLGEREPDQPGDERLEWDRDGQYYHYLTKWMHALHQVGAMTGDSSYNRWAFELAKTAHSAFSYQVRQEHSKRLFWKMSIDLTYPLVASMGQHDPLDGLVTCHEIRTLPARPSGSATPFDLSEEIADLSSMCLRTRWATDDPLGLGGLLFDAARVMQMMAAGDEAIDRGMTTALLDASHAGLKAFLAHKSLNFPATDRLAFRELGLAIGLHGVATMLDVLDGNTAFDAGPHVRDQLQALLPVIPLAETIESFWLIPANRRCSSWVAHEDINMVMLATSLSPGGFLDLQAAASGA